METTQTSTAVEQNQEKADEAITRLVHAHFQEKITGYQLEQAWIDYKTCQRLGTPTAITSDGLTVFTLDELWERVVGTFLTSAEGRDGCKALPLSLETVVELFELGIDESEEQRPHNHKEW